MAANQRKAYKVNKDKLFHSKTKFMKTKFFWLFVAAAVMTTAMTFTSCSEDDEPVIPEVIESEVLDAGVDEDITSSSNGTEGTELTYQSWIVVRGQTRAAFENKVTVTLNNRFNNVADEQKVTGFDFGRPEVSIDYKKNGEKKEQNFVTVTDSVLVYTLKYPNGFLLEYELLFQVAEYNDGISRQKMPYHQIESVRDNGMELSAMSNEASNGKTWLRKMCRHSVSVRVNGNEYEVGTAVIAKTEATGDYLVASKVVNQGIRFLSTDLLSGGKVLSWIEIEQQWSESGNKTVKEEVELNHTVSGRSEDYQLITPVKWKRFADLEHDMTSDTTVVSTRQNGSFTVTKHQTSHHLLLRDKDRKTDLSAIWTDFSYETAFYDDGMLSYEMPAPKFTGQIYEIQHDGFVWQNVGDEWQLPLKLRIIAYLDASENDDFQEPYKYEHAVTYIYRP